LVPSSSAGRNQAYVLLHGAVLLRYVLLLLQLLLLVSPGLHFSSNALDEA
jgi:hypothetical protein